MKTLEEVKAYPCEVLLCKDIADILKMDPQYIREAARSHPEKLGFPVIITKKCVKIPKAAFIKFMEGELHNK